MKKINFVVYFVKLMVIAAAVFALLAEFGGKKLWEGLLLNNILPKYFDSENSRDLFANVTLMLICIIISVTILRILKWLRYSSNEFYEDKESYFDNHPE